MRIDPRTWIALVVLGVLAAASCGGNAATAARPPDPAANSKGLREDREIEYAKPKGRLRIVCLGGSVAFGDGVARDATWEAWMQKNMRGQGFDVEVLDAGKPGRTPAESAALLESELLKYEPNLVVLALQQDESPPAAADLQKIETLLKSKGIVYILLAVPDYVPMEGYTPKAPAVYAVAADSALEIRGDKDAYVDDKGRWTEFAHQRMGNALAELIVGAPLICCATGPVSEEP